MAISNARDRDSSFVELEGLSTDTTPTEGIGINSRFFELDTNDTYYFTGEEWAKVGGE